jgi:WD40 repeat protein
VDDKLVASAGSDMFIKIWNVKDGSLLQDIKAHDNTVKIN